MSDIGSWAKDFKHEPYQKCSICRHTEVCKDINEVINLMREGKAKVTKVALTQELEKRHPGFKSTAQTLGRHVDRCCGGWPHV
jgi:hypothetical protein